MMKFSFEPNLTFKVLFFKVTLCDPSEIPVMAPVLLNVSVYDINF